MNFNDYRVVANDGGDFTYWYVGGQPHEHSILLTTQNCSLETLVRVASMHSNGVR